MMMLKLTAAELLETVKARIMSPLSLHLSWVCCFRGVAVTAVLFLFTGGDVATLSATTWEAAFSSCGRDSFCCSCCSPIFCSCCGKKRQECKLFSLLATNQGFFLVLFLARPYWLAGRLPCCPSYGGIGDDVDAPRPSLASRSSSLLWGDRRWCTVDHVVVQEGDG